MQPKPTSATPSTLKHIKVPRLEELPDDDKLEKYFEDMERYLAAHKPSLEEFHIAFLTPLKNEIYTFGKGVVDRFAKQLLGSRCARLSFWTLKVPPPAPPFMGAGPRVYPLGTPLGDHIQGTYRCGGCPLVCTIICVCMHMHKHIVMSHVHVIVHAPLLGILWIGCARGGLDRSRVKEVTSPAGEVGVTYPCKDLCRLCLDPRPQPFEVSPGVIGCM